MFFRIAFASLASLLLLPCLGFGVVGYAHARGESPGTAWAFGYLVLDLILLGALVAVWAGVFLRKDPDPRACEECGNVLGPGVPERCPECGRLTGVTHDSGV